MHDFFMKGCLRPHDDSMKVEQPSPPLTRPTMPERPIAPRPVRRFRVLLATLGFTAAAVAQAQGAPSTDLYVAPIQTVNGQRTIGPVEQITRRRGYDNQPAYAANGDVVYYTSQRDGHTDIHSYNLRNGASRPLFVAPTTDEYSAALTPDRQALSVIRVEADSSQRLWRFPLDGSDPMVLLPGIKPVGYHAWATDSTVLLFVLGQPATLQLANVRTGQSTVIARGIGRWLARAPGRAVIGVVRKPADATAMLAEFDIAIGTLRDRAPAMAGTDDYAWLPDGTILGAKGSALFQLAPGAREWIMVTDLAPQRITGITRMVVHPNGQELVFVANER
ncbi:MAG: hypothetical protein MUE41_06935 [Gemmatimonadaceae bacterium]|jgi:hypothetical protein|nr:hypothetical protein [Gemmatimonadaceae bacterium]